MLYGALVPAGNLGVNVLSGFRVIQFAGPEMADDIRSMTVDSNGRVLVSGPGYARYLMDHNQDGVADTSVDLLQTSGGGTGMEVLAADLFLMADTGLQRFIDTDGDGIPDPFPYQWLAVDVGEWGGQAVRFGPDGWVHAQGGHAAGFQRHLARLVGSPITDVEGGALLRLATHGAHTDVLADGFYDARDFAFSPEGDIFTWENGLEARVPLPGHRRPQLLMVEHGGHHGWRHEGSDSGIFWPEEEPRRVPALTGLPHGMISSLVCYRHYQFPVDLRQGLFAADWSSGKIYHVTLNPEGSRYRATVRTFMEAAGRSGFAPTALAVGVDGSLLVATGGRKARGGVYWVQYVADPDFIRNATNWTAFAVSDLGLAMDSPLPDAAWSRNFWTPVALNLGAAPFEAWVSHPDQDPLRRVRAIEILVELFGGISADTASVAARNGPPVVRARVAWALGRHPLPEDIRLLGALANDSSAYVRRHALAVLGDRAARLPLPFLQQIVASNLASPDRRVRLACARLLMALPEDAWSTLWDHRQSSLWTARATLLQGRILRSPGLDAEVVEEGVALLKTASHPEQQVLALRLTQAGLGTRSSGDMPIASAADAVQLPAMLLSSVADAAMDRLSGENAPVFREASRLLGMIRAGVPGLSKRLMERFTPTSSDEEIFHVLSVLVSLGDESQTKATGKVAEAVLSLGQRTGGENPVLSERWMTALLPLLKTLCSNDPDLAWALVRHPQFGKPEHARMVPLLGSERYLAAGRRIYGAATEQAGYRWLPETVDVVAGMPEPARLELLRKQWNRVALRDRVVLALAHEPAEADRHRYLWGLGSDDDEVVEASLIALNQLPRTTEGRDLAVLVRLLERLHLAGDQGALSVRALELFARRTGALLDPRNMEASLKVTGQWFRTAHPTLVTALDEPGTPHRVAWESKMKSVRWERGNVEAGSVLFRQLGCAYCHEGSRELGGHLGGYAGARSPMEVLDAVAYPDRQCDPHDRATVILLKDGTRHEGAVTHESAELMLIQLASRATVRVATRDVAQRFKSRRSLMPSGLVNDLRPPALADLHAYLKSLPLPAAPKVVR